MATEKTESLTFLILFIFRVHTTQVTKNQKDFYNFYAISISL